MASGRAPEPRRGRAGRDTARPLHKGIGDAVTVVASNDTTKRLHVVGHRGGERSVATQSGAGSGVFVRPRVYTTMAGPGASRNRS